MTHTYTSTSTWKRLNRRQNRSSPSNRSKVQVVQNAALRIATGCPMMACCRSPTHGGRGPHSWGTPGHAMRPVPSHLPPAAPPFLSYITADSGPRNMKQTLQRRYYVQVENFTREDGAIVDAAAARAVIHHTAMKESIRDIGIDRVLGTSAPTISEEEVGSSRNTRRTLSQLRSGFCPALEDYRQCVGFSSSNLCPCCGQGEQTVQHLFECSARLTDLYSLDLWTRPAETAEFLRTLPFSDLP